MNQILIIASLIFLFSCSDDSIEVNDFYKVYNSNSGDIAGMIDQVSKGLFIFGHQSVGYDILLGFSYWEKKSGSYLDRVTTREIKENDNSEFIDFEVGSNGLPKSKVDDFVSVIETIPDNLECTAFFKFCFVDIDEYSDVDEVFDYYQQKMRYLHEIRPNIRFVLVTTPLKIMQSDSQSPAKSTEMVNQAGTIDNIKRSKFNEMLLEELSDSFPVFDLARVESTLPNGDRCSFIEDGHEYFCLADVYSFDGGHMNEKGSQIAAYNLIAFLAGLK